MTHLTLAEKLAVAVNECDSMTLAEERRNDVERAAQRGLVYDQVRLTHYAERRKAIRDHRTKLVDMYFHLTGKNPWKDIPL